MDKRGWIKVYRELMYKPIWKQTTPQQKVILVTILLSANHEANTWIYNGKTYQCEPGQFVTSLENLAADCGKGVTIQNLRTALKLFEKLGFLTEQSTKNGRLITVVNWEKYQGQGDMLTNEITDSQQSINKASTDSLTTIKEIKNDKNVKNEKKDKTGKPGAPSPECLEIIDFLNQTTGQNYRPTTKATQRAINGRLTEGNTVEDFKTVIRSKAEEWLHDDKMRKYLTPDTLFTPSNFEKYLQAAKAQPPKPEKYSGLSEIMAKRTEETLQKTLDPDDGYDYGEFQ